MQLKNQIFYCIGFTHSFIHNSPMSLSFDFCLLFFAWLNIWYVPYIQSACKEEVVNHH